MDWPDLTMGKYGFYVWGSYLFALVLFVWELISLKQRKRALRQQQQRSSSVSPKVFTGSANETTS
jgi:heme exporter protein CcmD